MDEKEIRIRATLEKGVGHGGNSGSQESVGKGNEPVGERNEPVGEKEMNTYRLVAVGRTAVCG